jgi:hypothetical protein
MKIENAQYNFFETKDHYLQFRQAWKDYINSGQAKKQEMKYWGGTPYFASSLKCEHHLLYALLRGKDIHKLFVPNYKVHGQPPYYAFEQAKWKICIGIEGDTPYAKKRRAELLGPFGGTIDEDALKSVAEIIKGWKLIDPNTVAKMEEVA